MSICVKHRNRASMIVRHDLRKYKHQYMRRRMQMDKQKRAERIRRKQQSPLPY